MQDKKTWPFRISLPILWGDMDAFQHVNNVRYFRWFESGRIEYFRQLNLEQYLSNQNIGPILAHASCDYLQALTFPDTIEVKVSTSSIGSTSFTQDYLIVSQKTQKPAAQGKGVIVMLDYKTGTKVPIPEAMLAQIRALEQI